MSQTKPWRADWDRMDYQLHYLLLAEAIVAGVLASYGVVQMILHGPGI